MSIDLNTLTLFGIAVLNAITAGLGIFAVYYAKESQRATVKNQESIAKSKEAIDLIERNTNSLSTRMADLARKNGIVEGVQQGRQYGVDQAISLAEGQRQGIEMERASVAAQVPVPKVAPTLARPAGIEPVQVEDEAAATIAKAIAEATAVSAAATSEINKRVADATEKGADAQQQIADIAKEKSKK